MSPKFRRAGRGAGVARRLRSVAASPRVRRLASALVQGALLAGVFGLAFGFFFIQGLGRQFDRSSLVAPQFTGQPVEVARNGAQARGLRIQVREYRADPVAPRGTVLAQEPPAGTAIRAAQTLSLVVSAGKEAVEVPPLSGLNQRDAESRLAARKLMPGQLSWVYDREQTGKVLAQSPPPGAALIEGEPVSLLVGRAPQPRRFVMPDLKGRATTDTVAFFNRNKFLVQVEGPGDGKVTRQFPAAGAPLAEGTQIRLESSPDDLEEIGASR